MLEGITAPYFDSSRCAYLEEYEDASASSQNLTLVDLAGVFMILGMFILVSVVLWMFRQTPVAKQLNMSYDDDEGGQEANGQQSMKVCHIVDIKYNRCSVIRGPLL